MASPAQHLAHLSLGIELPMGMEESIRGAHVLDAEQLRGLMVRQTLGDEPVPIGGA